MSLDYPVFPVTELEMGGNLTVSFSIEFHLIRLRLAFYGKPQNQKEQTIIDLNGVPS